MSSIKGYSSQMRLSPPSQGGSRENYASVCQTDPKNRAGLDVLPKALYLVDPLAKTAETLDTTAFPTVKNPQLRIVKLTGALAAGIRKGDVLRFISSGSNPNMEIPVEAVTTDHIYLSGELVADPDTEDFYHMRYITLTIDSAGALSVGSNPIEFVRDGVDTQVVEDTVTPANNIPLPVKLSGVTGDINITANDLNVQTSHSAANPDSVQVGDGTEIMQINASGEAQVADDTARTSLASIDTKSDQSLLDTGNSSTTPLGIGGVFTGAAIDVSEYVAINVNIFTDQDAAADGLKVEYSPDGVNWDHFHTVNVTGGSGAGYAFPVEFRYARVVLTNGAVAQTSLRLQTILKKNSLMPSRYTVDQGITGNQHSIVTSSVIHGATTAGGGSYIPVKVNPSGALTVETTPSTLGQQVSASSAPVVLSTEQEAKIDTIITELQSSNNARYIITSSYTASPVIPTATRLATVTIPANTLATELEILTKVGDNFTAYDAAAAGNVIGRFTQAGGRIPVNLVAGSVIHLQSDTGADFSATDLTINVIGVSV